MDATAALREHPVEEVAADPEPPRDPVFEGWMQREFLWLPEQGMGRLRTSDPPYDEDYFANYQRLAATEMGRAITAARVDLVRRYAGHGHVVDVGIGCGAFILARGGWTWGYDVNPVGLRWLHGQGRFRDPYVGQHRSITLWDVLEHLEDPARLLANVVQWVFMSLPIVPGDGPPDTTWKHYKPREHCWYWTKQGLARWMDAHGFAQRHYSDTETRLGRQDIGTFVFERERPAP